MKKVKIDKSEGNEHNEEDEIVNNEKSASGIKNRVLVFKKEKLNDSCPTKLNPFYKSTEDDKEIKSGDKMLLQAISTKDLSYIAEFLINKNRSELLNSLDANSKELLGELLIEFVDQPLRLEALSVIKEIVINIPDTQKFVKKIQDKSQNYNKLIYIKGKIDYLKFLKKQQSAKKEPEVIIKE